MSETPETDAAIIERRHIHKINGSVQLLELIDADVARELERERDEARAALQRITECDMRWSKKIARDSLEGVK